ncbi:ImmA/IrrE family metallo-endopeptidase [Deinococcus humi]|uniref:IrrE N-terminal-like domain-containing protein n=1 Tax=Deinococcus humi TaxID=662880 RepID=A0A7W8NFS0_9DEIO|nr:ImmA/IrrE family metallo-endopeptidase [Deinococcus humi]MBB5364035.1 hypothetical protein [Deinococcus humi]GGO32592.1 hypothetical protein GCM10008949_30350 [Deinococcus humi]
MRDASHAALAYAAKIHAQHGYETCPERLCAALGIRVIPGRENRAVNGPPSIITLRQDRYAPRQKFTMHHEIAHVLIQRAGLEDAVLNEVDGDDANEHLEAVASHMGAALLMPASLVRQAIRDWGDRPEAILRIQQGSGASFPAALVRYVTHDLEASRGAFATSGSYVAHAASINMRPIYRYDRVPDPRASFPEAALLSIPNRARTVGVMVF